MTTVRTMSWTGAALLVFMAQAASAEVAPAAGVGVVNLNNATLVELSRLPGVGLGKAGRIVERRKTKAFRAAEDLLTVKGFGRVSFKRLKPYLSVSGATTLRAKVIDRPRPPRAQKKVAPPPAVPMVPVPSGMAPLGEDAPGA